MQRTIIFCRSYDSCTHVYYFIRSKLGRDLTEPKGYPNHPELRLVDMFTACTHPDVKYVILTQFRNEHSTLRVMIATIAFGMGLDCPNVRYIGDHHLISSKRPVGLVDTVELFSAVKDCSKFSDESMNVNNLWNNVEEVIS